MDNEIIQKKIDEIYAHEINGLSSLTVIIECPLDSGIKVRITGSAHNGIVSPQLSGVRDFYNYIKEYRANYPDKRFNIVRITANGPKLSIRSIDMLFDPELQIQADADSK